MNFQDLWNKFFLFIFGQLCDKKTFAFVVMGIGKKNLCGLEVGWAEIIRQTVSFLLVCVCVCGAEGGLGGHDQASNVAQVTKHL